jgi:predicted nucleic acid-binding protein
MTYLLDTNAISDLMRAAARIENWMAGLEEDDRVVICTIIRGEILYGIGKLPEGKRRSELEHTGHQFLTSFRCEPVPEEAGDFYATVKRARQQQGLALDENDLWVAATALALGATLVAATATSRESTVWQWWHRNRARSPQAERPAEPATNWNRAQVRSRTAPPTCEISPAFSDCRPSGTRVRNLGSAPGLRDRGRAWRR